MQEKNNVLYTSLSIIVAGALIAGAIYLTKSAPSNPVKNTAATSQSPRAVSASDHILGNPDAEIVIVEYADTECPPCKSFHATMSQVMDNYAKSGEVAWVFRHMPIAGLHKKAQKEAEATECAFEQGGNTAFWSFVNRIYEITPSNDGLDPAKLTQIAKDQKLDVTKFTECLSTGKYASKVNADYADGLIATNNRPGTPFVRMLTKGKVTDAMITKIDSIFGPGEIKYGNEGQSVIISGALSFQYFDMIIQTLLGK
jgi:protein-disulfide isomerase